MRILFISNAVGLWRGGHGRNIFLLAQALKKRGHVVEFFSHHFEDNLEQEWGVKVHSAGLARYSIPLFSKSAVEFIRQARNRYDIIHCNGGSSYGVAEIERSHRVPVVLHLRASNYRNAMSIFSDDLLPGNLKYLRSGIATLYEWYFDRRAILACDQVFCNSRSTLQALTEKTNPKAGFSVFHNGIELPEGEYARDNSESATIGYFARFYLQKGWKYFFQIARRIADSDDKINFLIAGRGPLEHDLKGLSKKYGLSEKINYFGRIDSSEKKARFFQSIGAFLCPTAPGTTSLEALSFGLPLIVARRSKDVADGMDLDSFIKDGSVLLMQNAEPGEAAAKSLEFISGIDHTGLQLKIRRVLEEEYSWDKIAEQAELRYNVLFDKQDFKIP